MRALLWSAALAGVALLVSAATAAISPGAGVVSPQWLASHIADRDLVLLHVGAPEEFPVQHIAGARAISLSDVAAPEGGNVLEMPSAAALEQRLEALGISDRSRIVVYYGNDWVTPATRIIFTLRAAGLGERVSLLDGGMQAWIRAGQQTTTEASPQRQGSLSTLQLRSPVVDAAFVRAHLNTRGYVVVDARAQMFYDGVQAAGANGHEQRGHIPGAVSIPFTSFTNDDFTVKSDEEVRAIFRAAGVRAGDRLIVYCHVGQQGTGVIFAARQVGIDAVLYDGSFEDWTRRELPVETPARP